MEYRNRYPRRIVMLLFGIAIGIGQASAQEKPAPAPSAPAAPASTTATPSSASPAPASADVKSDAQAKPPSAKQKDRVFMKDLEGTWISRDYVERLKASRSPSEAARKGGGVAIKIQREGPTYPILITNFQRAILQAVIDVQPDIKPKSYRLAIAKEDRPAISASELTYMRFRGERDAGGTFKTLSISEPNFAKGKFLTYERLAGGLENFVNATVIAGRYTDAEGKRYEFTEAGEAVLPDRKFQYEVSLDPKAAINCDLIESHREREQQGRERLGFRWKGEHLQLFKVVGSKAPYKCEAQPFAVLSQQ